MDDSHGPARVVRFGVFEADLQTGELHKNGVRVPMQGQLFQVCAILLSHPGELVTREELRQKVWPEDTFVDFDQALNTAIGKIRIALGDDCRSPQVCANPASPRLSFHRLTRQARFTSARVGRSERATEHTQRESLVDISRIRFADTALRGRTLAVY